MDWSKGYSARFYMMRVDPATWRDVERYELTGGSVKREMTGLRESAEVDCSVYPQGVEYWIRIWMDVEQAGSNEHVALFTGLATSPALDIDGIRKSSALDCYSVLKPADDVNLLRGWYAPAGMSGAAVIKQLLSVTPAPVSVADGSPTLTSHIVAEDDETHLTMVEKILLAINWRIRIDGNGAINVGPASADPVAMFDPLKNDVIENKIKVSADWFDAPNVFMAVEDDLTAIARDDNSDSPLSVRNRGREVWMQESGCELANNETIESYANRRLAEAQRVYKTAEYDRRYFPGIVPLDYIRMHYPEQGLEGLCRVISQSIQLTHNATTSESIMVEI